MEKQTDDRLLGVLHHLGLSRPWIDSFRKMLPGPNVVTDVDLQVQNVYPKERMRYDLFLQRREQVFTLEKYKVTLFPIPEIEDCVIGNVDTAALDREMQRMDWQQDYRLLEERLEESKGALPDKEKELYNRYVGVIYHIITLAATDEGKAISDALKMKYFKGTPYEDRFLPTEIQERYSRQADFIISDRMTVTFEEAANLLQGRFVWRRQETSDTACWLGLDKQPSGKVPLYTEGEVFFPDFDIMPLLEKLPLLSNDSSLLLRIQSQLRAGQSVAVQLNIRHRMQKFFLEADPEHRSLPVYDEHHKLIATSLDAFCDKLQAMKSKNKPRKPGKLKP